MKIMPSLSSYLGKSTMLGLIFSAVFIAPVFATELVGKSAAPTAAASASAASQTLVPTPVVPAASQPPEPLPAPHREDAPEDAIKGAIAEAKNDFDMGSSFGNFSMNPDVIVPIVALLLLFGGPLILVIVLAVLHYRSKARRLQNINANIDKLLAAGRDIPIELLRGDEPYIPKDEGNLHKGMRNIGLGVGWLAFLTLMFGLKLGAFGFVFIGLGLSQVIVWKLSGAPSNSAIDSAHKVQD